MNLRKLIKEEIAKTLYEGVMSDINLMAQEAKDFNSFVKEFMKEYSDAPGDENDLKDWLQSVYDDAKSMEENVITEATTKTILGVQFNVVPAQAGMKFEFKNVNQFRKSGIHVNELVDEITKMLDSKFGKGLFTFMPAGRDQTDPKVNGLEFRMSANQFFKGL
jgi:hypothetical protein